MSDNRAHYAVFWHEAGGERSPKWCRVSNRRNAIIKARYERGYAVRVPYGSNMVWDAPTFKVCGDVISDFRPQWRRR